MVRARFWSKVQAGLGQDLDRVWVGVQARVET